MKTPKFFIAGILGTFSIVLLMTLQAQQNVQPVAESKTITVLPQKWEHLALPQLTTKHFSSPELARKINQLGDQGWELVTVENFSKSGTTMQTVYYFKRPKR